MTDQSPFLFSVERFRYHTSCRAPPIDSFLQLSLTTVSWCPRDGSGIRCPRPRVRGLETPTQMHHRSPLDRRRPKATRPKQILTI